MHGAKRVFSKIFGDSLVFPLVLVSGQRTKVTWYIWYIYSSDDEPFRFSNITLALSFEPPTGHSVNHENKMNASQRANPFDFNDSLTFL